jgi:hypothetical protein
MKLSIPVWAPTIPRFELVDPEEVVSAAYLQSSERVYDVVVWDGQYYGAEQVTVDITPHGPTVVIEKKTYSDNPDGRPIPHVRSWTPDIESCHFLKNRAIQVMPMEFILQ